MYYSTLSVAKALAPHIWAIFHPNMIYKGKLQMNLYYGLKYNIRGVAMALKTPKLLVLGILRFAIVLFFTLFLSGLVLYWHNEILTMIWTMPESGLLLYLWKAVSWILSLFLAGVAMVLSLFNCPTVFLCCYHGLYVKNHRKNYSGKRTTL